MCRCAYLYGYFYVLVMYVDLPVHRRNTEIVGISDYFGTFRNKFHAEYLE